MTFYDNIRAISFASYGSDRGRGRLLNGFFLETMGKLRIRLFTDVCGKHPNIACLQIVLFVGEWGNKHESM